MSGLKITGENLKRIGIVLPELPVDLRPLVDSSTFPKIVDEKKWRDQLERVGRLIKRRKE